MSMPDTLPQETAELLRTLDACVPVVMMTDLSDFDPDNRDRLIYAAGRRSLLDDLRHIQARR